MQNGPGPSPQTARVIVVDDEAPGRRMLMHLLEDRRDVQVVRECSTGDEAITAIRGLRPDVVFLDVQMPGCSGIEVVQALDASDLPVIVFVTAYRQYAIDAFEASAIDYLLKPYSAERFEAALERALHQVRQRARSELADRISALISAMAPAPGPDAGLPRDAHRDRFAVRDRHGTRLIPAREVEWIEAVDVYARIHTRSREAHLIRQSLGEIEETLDPRVFVRVHRSAIVNVAAVDEIRARPEGNYDVVLQSGAGVRMARARRATLESRLNAGG